MFCLLCHEKIPRLRAWRTKSEFCCDEHADLYKKQTLERLLTDQEHGKSSEAPPLPIEAPAAQTSKRSGEEVPSHAQSILARFADEKPVVKSPLPLPEPVQKPLENRDAGVQELWRLAEEVGNSDVESSDEEWGLGSRAAQGRSKKTLPLRDSGVGSPSASPQAQSAEEALAALRAIASSSRPAVSNQRPTRALVKDPAEELDSALAADDPGGDELGTAVENELDFRSADEELSAHLEAAGSLDDDSLLSLDPGTLAPLDDDELPSIFDRLTESSGGYPRLSDVEPAAASEERAVDPEPVDQIAQSSQIEEIADLENLAELEEVAASPELEAPVAAAEEVAAESAPQTAEEVLEIRTAERKTDGLDFLAEAVESHLEDPKIESRLVRQEPSRKVLPFPPPRDKTPAVAEPEKVTSAPERVAAPPQKPLKSKKAGDASRLQMKPVATMLGLEPALRELEGKAFNFAAHNPEQVAGPQLNFPAARSPQGRTRRSATRLPLAARLWVVLPNAPELPPLEAETGYSAAPDYEQPCRPPQPLASGIDVLRGRSIGSQRTRLFAIEPALQDALPFEFRTVHGETSFSHLELPAAILNGAAAPNGSGRLDLSGPEGKFEPSVDRAFLVMPEISELNGSPRSSSKSEGNGSWMPPTVLDPRFEIERPIGRDLSDFG